MNTEIKLHKAPDGYTDVPGIPYFAVTEDGRVWNKRSNIPCTISVQKSGYRTVAIGINKKTITHYVHRLVALTHIPIPSELVGIPNLEVNHKFGDKSKNGKDDLEWCTPKQNIRHAYSSGFYKGKKLSDKTKNSPVTPIAVEVRNILTDKVVVFPDISTCASIYGICRRRLARHLESDKAGLLTKNWCVFRKPSKEPWPHIPDDRKMENRWDQPYGMYFVREDGSGVTGYCETMTKLAEMTGIPFSSIQSVVRTDGRQYKLNNHTFWYDEYPVETIMSGSKYRKKHEFSEVRNVKVYDFKTDKTTIYESVRKAAKALGISPTRLHYYIKNKKPHDGKAYWLV